MLAGYFDESGTSDRDVYALYGGIVADTVIWSRIEVRWLKKLTEFGIEQYHAAELENRLGDFQPYSRGIRDALTNYFSALVSEIECQAFGVAILRDDWNALVPEHGKREFGYDPLLLAAAALMQRISLWSEQCMNSEPVALVFARHKTLTPALEIIHATLRAKKLPGLGSISFAQPADLVPLQVADMFAYELRKYLRDPDGSRQAKSNFARGPGKMEADCSILKGEGLANLVRHLWPEDPRPSIERGGPRN